MGEKKYSKEDWNKALEDLSRELRIYVPVRSGDFHNFKVLEEGVKPDFSFRNTRLSPKFLAQPQSERMFEYNLEQDGEEAHILRESPKDFSPQAVVGIRPCDAHAFELVKVNFDNPAFRDPWWVRRYESTTFVGLGCNDPCSTCFCTSTGSGPFSEKGLDVLLYDLGEDFLARAITEKGETFLEKMKGGIERDKEALRQVEGLKEAAPGKIRSSLETDRLKDQSVNGLFEAPFWEEVAFACLNCGTCTYLCPTCWCFDIQDEVQGKEGDRIRNWDACMFPLFTLHGSGHNPRDNKFQRVRQRFMHKLKYYVDKYGDGVACVGCGRCVQFCPVNIDIREVCEKMNRFS
jgi:ferredoxin